VERLSTPMYRAPELADLYSGEVVGPQVAAMHIPCTMCTHVHMHMRMHTHVHMRMHTHVHMHMHMRMHMHMHMHMHAPCTCRKGRRPCWP